MTFHLFYARARTLHEKGRPREGEVIESRSLLHQRHASAPPLVLLQKKKKRKKKIKSPTSASPSRVEHSLVCLLADTLAQNSRCTRVVWVSSPQSYYPPDGDDNDSRPPLWHRRHRRGHGRENSTMKIQIPDALSLLRAFEAEACRYTWHIITARCVLYMRWQSSARRVDRIRYPGGFRIGDKRKRDDKVGEGRRRRRRCRVERGEKATQIIMPDKWSIAELPYSFGSLGTSLETVFHT